MPAARIDANRERAGLILETLSRIGLRMAQVREAFAGTEDADPQAADELHQARHALKRALLQARRTEAGPRSEMRRDR